MKRWFYLHFRNCLRLTIIVMMFVLKKKKVAHVDGVTREILHYLIYSSRLNEMTFIITTRQRSCGKVVISVMYTCLCLLTGGPHVTTVYLFKLVHLRIPKLLVPHPYGHPLVVARGPHQTSSSLFTWGPTFQIC